MLIVFDWDGTLINSIDKIIRCMRLAIEELGFDGRDDQAIRHIIGLSLADAAQCLFPEISTESSVRLGCAFRRHFLRAEQEPCLFYDGVVKGLDQLRSQGFRLALATSKSRKGLDAVLAGLGWSDYFDATRCADEAESKPHPLMLQQLLQECSVSSDQAVMVGDTVFDLQMADNAGVDGVAVTYGAHGRERLQHCQPKLCVDRFDELLMWQGLNR